MTIPEHIGIIRNLIKEWSDDTEITDEAIYHYLLLKRNKYMSQRFRKYYNISEELISNYCMELEEGLSHDCDCVKVGCKVLKTVHKIPATLSGRNRDLIKVYDMQLNEIGRVTPEEQKTNQLDDIKSDSVKYSLINQKIIIWNTLDMKAIIVSGVWEDETEFDGITLCEEEGEETTNDIDCFNLDETQFKIDADLIDYIHTEVMQMLQVPLQITSDNTNDSNPNIKA